MASTVKSVHDFISNCPALASDEMHVDEIGSKPGYSIVPMPGARILSTDILGNRNMTYPFALISRAITVDDYARIENAGVFEDFAEWLDDQTDNENFPDLGAAKTVTSIGVTSWGYLYQTEQNAQTGIYQIVCVLNYTKTKG